MYNKFVKISVIIFLMMFTALSSKAQVSSVKTNAYKIYDDNRMIAYITVYSFDDLNQASLIKEKIVNNSDFIKFDFNSNDYNTCMIETNKYMTEDEIKLVLNNIIIEYKNRKLTKMEKK